MNKIVVTGHCETSLLLKVAAVAVAVTSVEGRGREGATEWVGVNWYFAKSSIQLFFEKLPSKSGLLLCLAHFWILHGVLDRGSTIQDPQSGPWVQDPG